MPVFATGSSTNSASASSGAVSAFALATSNFAVASFVEMSEACAGSAMSFAWRRIAIRASPSTVFVVAQPSSVVSTSPSTESPCTPMGRS